MKSNIRKTILASLVLSILLITGCTVPNFKGWTRDADTPDVEWVIDWKAEEVPVALTVSMYDSNDTMSVRACPLKFDSTGNLWVLSDSIMKFTPDGEKINEISWSGSGANSVITPMDMALDSKDNIYILGLSGKTPDFDPGPEVVTENPSGGQNTTSLVKLDPDGNYIWGHSWLGSEFCNIGKGGYSVCCDETDNCYISSQYMGDVGTIEEGHGSYIAKFNPDGKEKWRFKWQPFPWNILAGNDALYIVGQTSGKTDFDPGKGEAIIDVINAGFLSKFTSDGKYAGTRTFRSTGVVPFISSIALDSKGNILIGGAEEIDPTKDWQDQHYWGVLYKLTPDGDDIWSKYWGGGQCGCIVTCISVDDKDNIFAGGTLTFGPYEQQPGNTDLDPSANIDKHFIHRDDIFINKFDSDGNFQWAGTWGNENTDWVRSIANDKSGGIYMLGSFDGSVDFDPGPGKSIINGKGLEAFLLKLQE